VQHWLADEPVTAWREPWTIRARRWVVRHRTGVAAGVAALAVAAAGLAVALTMQAQANRELRAALEPELHARTDASAQSSQAEAAIESCYRGISEDVILRRPEQEQLRGRLLGAALDFYKKRLEYLTHKRESGGGSREIDRIVVGLDHAREVARWASRRRAKQGDPRAAPG
jgi:hypothetical protein